MSTTSERLIERSGRHRTNLEVGLAAAVSVKKGWPIGLNASGYAGQLGQSYPRAVGMSQYDGDNTSGAAGDVPIGVEAGVFTFKNSGTSAITIASIGLPCYLEDNETASASDQNGTLVVLGEITQVDSDGVRVRIGDPVGVIVRSARIQHSDLVAAATTESVAIGVALPANAALIGYSVDCPTLFSGGSVSACTLKIGTNGDDDAVMAATSVFTGATGFPKAATPGVLGYPGAPLGGQIIYAKFTTTADNTVNLSAGDCRVRLYFAPVGG